MFRGFSSGFALPLVLIVLALLSALSVGLVRSASMNSELLLERRSQWEEELALRDTAERIVYLLLTGSYSPTGVSNDSLELMLNGEPAQIDGFQVSAQSWSGLYGISVLGVGMLESALRPLIGRDQAQAVAAEMSDWTDADNLRRFRGMEASDYRSRGLPQRPRNAAMRSIEELVELPTVTPEMMMSTSAGLGLRDVILVGGDDNFDAGTAPDFLIGPVLGLPDPIADEVNDARREGDWDRVRFLIDEYHWVFNDHPPFYKGQNYRVSFESEAGIRSRIQFALTPYGSDALYEIVAWQVPDYGYE